MNSSSNKLVASF